MIRALAICLALATPASAEHLVIDSGSSWSLGGSMRSFIRKRDRVGSVEIVGKCFSSCPIFLDHPASCVHRGATFGFHGLRKWGRYASWDIQVDYTRYLGNPALGDWFLANAAQSTDMVYLSGSDLIDDFGERECPA